MFEPPQTPDKLKPILVSLRHELEQLLRDKIVAIYLYGSQARGDAHPDSDIDVLVVLRGQFDYFDMVERTGQIAAELSLEYETVICDYSYTETISRISADQILIWGREFLSIAENLLE